MAFATLGTASVNVVDPGNLVALARLNDMALSMSSPVSSGTWPWPEPRLSYANALLPDSMMAAVAALNQPILIQNGLTLLRWLLRRETRDDHLSVTPAHGSGPRDLGASFD